MDIYERIDDILRQKENLQDELVELLKEKENLEKEEHDKLLYLPITLAQKPFLSLEGESLRQGQPVLFIRFQNCNMFCHSDIYSECHCDSVYSIGKENPNAVTMTVKELLEEIEKADCKNIAITGGEPLMHQQELFALLDFLYYEDDYDLPASNYDITIETNGSYDIRPLKKKYPLVHIIGDWKCKVAFGENANKKMFRENLRNYSFCDALKFVVTKDDFPEVIEVLEGSQVYKRTNIYISPAWGCVDMKDVVDFVLENRKYGMILSLQIHKLYEVEGKTLAEIGKKSADNIWL